MIDLELKNKNECTGCFACENICPKNCISMKTDTEGFWYPKVDYDKCIMCRKCINACPTMNKNNINNEPKAYACINKDENIRLNSSSGGMFSLIAEQVIKNGGVVFGAKFNNQWQVVHSYVEKEEDLWKFRGSKYVQSKIGQTYKTVKAFLQNNKFVLFSGTPCQIAGLKSFLGKEYERLFCVDIICHGVPSPDIWEKYLNYQKANFSSHIQSINLRDKKDGWKNYSVSILFGKNLEYINNSKKDLYIKAFLKNVCLRPSCYNCQFKSINRESDITLADFWGIQKVAPNIDDNKGTSMIIINSKKGDLLFRDLLDKTVYEKVEIENAIKYNSSAVKSVNYNPKREQFMKDKDNLSFDKLVKKYCSDKLILKIKRKLKRLYRKLIKYKS